MMPCLSPPEEENAMKLVASVAAFVVALAVALPASAQQPAPAPTLYKRLGGYDAMAAVTDDFLRRLTSDPAFGRSSAATAPIR